MRAVSTTRLLGLREWVRLRDACGRMEYCMIGGRYISCGSATYRCIYVSSAFAMVSVDYYAVMNATSIDVVTMLIEQGAETNKKLLGMRIELMTSGLPTK